MSNAVESLLVRLGIQSYYPAFRDNAIDRLMHLRALTEDDLKKYIPEAKDRQILLETLARNASAADAPAAPRYDDGDNRPRGGRREGGAAGESRRPRPKRTCRDFFEGFGFKGCGYGDECRFSHDPEQYEAERKAQNSIPSTRETYREEISVPWDSVKLLLGNKAEKLHRINFECGTSNSRIEKPEAFHQTYTFEVKGPFEGVKKAKIEIEKFVGITSSRNREARFQYAHHELERNRMSVEYLSAANVKHQGTALELSSTVLQRVARTFRFQHEPKVTQFWHLSNGTDKDKFETLLPLVKQFKGIQCIIFTELKRVEEMAKRSKQTAEALGVKNPQFLHRNLLKEERMKALEAFKQGEVNEEGVRQRVLVTSNDYAKLARKILIPYINLVLHFSMPKTKEFYLLQTNCTGRNNHEGISLLFITHHDATVQKEWSAALDLKEMSHRAFEDAVRKVDYDTETNPLTSPAADPDPNWREAWEREKAEKAAAKTERTAAQ